MMHISTSRNRLQPMTLRNSSPSRPDMPTAAAAMARFCGLTILPSTPPEELAPAISTGSNPGLGRGLHLQRPEQRLDEVSDPVTATPIQPRIGEMIANRPPVSASQAPSEPVWPEVHDVGQARTAMTVTMADLSSTYVAP